MPSLSDKPCPCAHSECVTMYVNTQRQIISVKYKYKKKKEEWYNERSKLETETLGEEKRTSISRVTSILPMAGVASVCLPTNWDGPRPSRKSLNWLLAPRLTPEKIKLRQRTYKCEWMKTNLANVTIKTGDSEPVTYPILLSVAAHCHLTLLPSGEPIYCQSLWVTGLKTLWIIDNPSQKWQRMSQNMLVYKLYYHMSFYHGALVWWDNSLFQVTVASTG